MKVLVAIGCNHYSNDGLSNLSGAENDANAIFDLLVTNGGDFYDPENSILLNSPSLREAKESLQKIIFDLEGDVEICIFFAGHGGIKDGAYFLCVNDTSVDRLSASAISITELFMWINEAHVQDTCLIIDACQAGGIAQDIGAFIKPDSIGQLGSPSVSVLAAAAADQDAREIDGQGIATSAILKCLTGEVFVQKNYPGLNLIEIGQVLSELMENNNEQAPVYWGLNLFGRSSLFSNPCFEATSTPLIGLPEGLNRSATDEPVIKQHATKVWELYLASSRNFDTAEFVKLAQSLLHDLPPESNAAPVVIDALATTFRNLLGNSLDPFEEIELLGASLACLAEYIEDDELACNVAIDLSYQLTEALHLALASVLSALEENQFALLSERSGISDLYYLPIRILKIYGWIGAGQFIATQNGLDKAEHLQTRQQLACLIFDIYTCSIVAVSDEQTCSFTIFLRMARSMGLAEEAEQIFGLLCNSFHSYKGEIANAKLTGSEAFKFIKARAKGDLSDIDFLVAKPSEFLSALILGSETLGLSEVVDRLIQDFDHMNGKYLCARSAFKYC